MPSDKAICDHCGRHLTCRTILKHLEQQGPLTAQKALFHSLNVDGPLRSGISKHPVRPRKHYRRNRYPHIPTPPPCPDEDAGMHPIFTSSEISTPSNTEEPDDHILRLGTHGLEDNEDFEQEYLDKGEQSGSDDKEFVAAYLLQGLSALDALGEEFDKVVSRLNPASCLSEDDMYDIRAFNLKLDTVKIMYTVKPCQGHKVSKCGRRVGQ
ncbi:uncharacterized protein C8R40DRAFT_1175730 [Lentinula edodes]|uniref:uncharacterized protein n=1 Tax=Lentinula edodes TaxID=5353 RepID=UPI001E8DEAFA|nr:uncharacterized protein C8R40DRAFT_1175730 [Lentinula edodes]KAH7870258.1 hypothetical protein C8R40DRAFT_1175730 [Lentinula edodes]